MNQLELQKPLKREGFLLQRSTRYFIRRYLKLWFVLDGPLLLSFHNCNRRQPSKYVINLRDAGIRRDAEKRIVLCLVDGKHVILKASSPQERDSWIADLQRAKEEVSSTAFDNPSTPTGLAQFFRNLIKNLKELIKKILKVINWLNRSNIASLQRNDEETEVDEEEEFYDCVSSFDSNSNEPSSSSSTSVVSVKTLPDEPRPTARRIRIPNKPPSSNTSVRSFLTTFKGLPLDVHEPLTLLQRMALDFEYAELLDLADKSDKNALDEFKYVAAFAVSCYSLSSQHQGKPFESFLGETYECDRSQDLGWRLISEQVGTKPTSFVQMVEGRNWTCTQEYTIETQLSLLNSQLLMKGNTHLHFQRSGHHYVWNRVPATIKYSFITGKLHVEHLGILLITNTTTGDQCRLNFKDKRCVSGVIDMHQTSKNTAEKIDGTWDSKLLTSDGKILWERTPPSSYSAGCYGFSQLACQLNEDEKDVAPTDSRRRPDVRLMEMVEWDKTIEEKLRLKEKMYKKQELANEDGSPPHKPVWFDLSENESQYVSNGKYWNCKRDKNWTPCPPDFFD